MNSKAFRDELKKIMPGYRWTVQRKIDDKRLFAEGSRFIGPGQTSVLVVGWVVGDGRDMYYAKACSADLRSETLGMYEAPTLPQALYGLQDYLTRQASSYQAVAMAIHEALKVHQ